MDVIREIEKEQLVELTQKGQPGARKIKRANILLLASMGKTDAEIATILHTSIPTVCEPAPSQEERIKQLEVQVAELAARIAQLEQR